MMCLAMIVITVVITVMAALPRLFQIVAFLFRLFAVLAVATDSVVQIFFSFPEFLLALIITVNSVHRDYTTCEEKRSHQGHDHSFVSDLV
jgi:energy-coupling factor transporter transmembrane protein EcfT